MTLTEPFYPVEPILHVDEDVNWCSHDGEQYGGSLKH